MKKVSKLSLMAIVLVAVLSILGTQVFASGVIDLSNTPSPSAGNNTATNNAAVDNGINNTIAPINSLNTANTTTNNSVYNNTNLPATGAASDFTVVALVVVCIVSAVYAYKKIRDYNIK